MKNKTNNINKINQSFASFISCRHFLIYSLLSYKVAKIDVLGAESAEDWGLMYLSTKNALGWGLRIYLLERGYNPFDPVDVLDDSRYELFSQLANCLIDDHDLFQEALLLECSNPSGSEEIKKYFSDCSKFVENKLEINKFWVESGNDVEIKWLTFHRWGIETMDFLETFGQSGVFSSDDFKKIIDTTAILSN